MNTIAALLPALYLLQLLCGSSSVSSACLSAPSLAATLAPDSQVILKGIQIMLVVTQLYASLHALALLQAHYRQSRQGGGEGGGSQKKARAVEGPKGGIQAERWM